MISTMAKIPLKYVNSFYDRGKLRHLVRVPGQKAKTLHGVPGSEEFMAAYHAALAMVPGELGAVRGKPGSFDALITAYYKSKVFTHGFASETQRVRRAILEGWRRDHGDKRVAHLRPQDVSRFLELKKPYAQKNWLKALRGLMLFAIAQEYRADDPTKDARPVRPPKSQGHMTWEHPEIEAYRNAHALGSVARLALELMLNVAARRGDAYQLGPQHIKDGKLCWRPSKTKRSTGKPLSIRILPELQAALDAMPRTGNAVFLVTAYGRPFASALAFGNKFADWCRQAGLKSVQCDDGRVRNYRAHGLRKAACKALAHAGCTAPQIMSIGGHSNLTQVQIYIDEVEQERMAEDAMSKLTAARK
jgi:integrase